jgi:hypothetical protein
MLAKRYLMTPQTLAVTTTSSAQVGARTLRFGFSTLGCTDLNPDGLRSLAAANGVRFIELRGIGGELYLPGWLSKQPGGAQE